MPLPSQNAFSSKGPPEVALKRVLLKNSDIEFLALGLKLVVVSWRRPCPSNWRNINFIKVGQGPLRTEPLLFMEIYVLFEKDGIIYSAHFVQIDFMNEFVNRIRSLYVFLE